MTIAPKSIHIDDVLNASHTVLEYIASSPHEVEDATYLERTIYELFVKTLLRDNRPVLFLDIDGVLDGEDLDARDEAIRKANAYDSLEVRQACSTLLNKNALAHLHSLTTAFPHMVIILHSDWRKGLDLVAIRALFSAFPFFKYIIDKTEDYRPEIETSLYSLEDEAPNLSRIFSTRSVPIIHRIAEYGITNYVIVDDLDLGTHFQNRFIQIDPDTLLTQQDVQKATALFRQKVRREPLYDSLPIHIQTNLEALLKKYHLLSIVHIEKIFLTLAKYQGKRAHEQIEKVLDILTPFQRMRFLLEISSRRQKESVMHALAHAISLNEEKRRELLLTLITNIRHKEFVPIFTLLTSTCKALSTQSKNALLERILGARDVVTLYSSKEPLVYIENYVATHFKGKQEMVPLLSSLYIEDTSLLSSDIKNELFQVFAHNEEDEARIMQLLEQKISSQAIVAAIAILTKPPRNGSTELIKHLLTCKKFGRYEISSLFCSLSRSQQHYPLLTQFLSEPLEKETVERGFCALIEHEGSETLLWYLFNKFSLSHFAKAEALQQLVLHNKEPALINALCEGDEKERGSILCAFTRKLVPSEGNLHILTLLRKRGLSNDDYRGQALLYLAAQRKDYNDAEPLEWLDKMIKLCLQGRSLQHNCTARSVTMIIESAHSDEIVKFILTNCRIDSENLHGIGLALSKRAETEALLRWYLNTYKGTLLQLTHDFIALNLVQHKIMRNLLIQLTKRVSSRHLQGIERALKHDTFLS